MYPTKDERNRRTQTLRLMLETLNEQGNKLNIEVSKINAELKILEYLEMLEESK